MLSNIPWQSLVLVQMLLTTISFALGKYQIHRGSSFQGLIYKYIASTGLVSSVWWLIDGQLPLRWWLLFIFGFAGAISVAARTAAFRHSLSQTVLTSPIQKLLAIIWAGVILGEFALFNLAFSQGRLIVLGMIIAVLLLFLFYEPTTEARRWQQLMSFSIIYGSFTPVVTKLFLPSSTPVSILMMFYWGSLTSTLLVAWFRSRRLFIDRRFALTGLIQGLIGASGVLLWFTALDRATVTEVGLLQLPLFTLLTTGVGLFWFKERKALTKKKIAGMILALVLLGVVLSIKN